MTALAFDNSYARLPDRFFARAAPTPVAAPRLIALNRPLAAELGIDADRMAAPDGVAVLAGNRVPDGAEPLALAYAGHQFGQFVPQLGDGRAVLLGEVVDRSGRRRDVQLKGSGPTPYSRRGDGRAALGPVLREYVVSEAMHALGIPTTRALAAVATGEAVMRETVLPGAVLTRVAASHVRVGTFQFLAARRDVEGLRALADHVLARHYPAAAGAEHPYRALLEAVIAAQAGLVARWLLVGFVHGVMNTDNTSVAGETIDYGPCAFLDAYDPAAVFSSIDAGGRYAYGNQPAIALWNLARFAEALVPLLADAPEDAVREAEARLEAFAPTFEAAYRGGLARKLGLLEAREGDAALAGEWLDAMAAGGADFTLAFRRLAELSDPAGSWGDDAAALRGLFADAARLEAWWPRWRARLAEERAAPDERRAAMRAANPAVIPRNHRVEAVIQAGLAGDFAPFAALNAALARPYEDPAPGAEAYIVPPRPEERVLRTFCGT